MATPNLPQVALATLQDKDTQNAIAVILGYLRDLSLVPATQTTTTTAAPSSTGLVAGMMMMWPKATPPDGWMIYIDSPLSQFDYPSLYAIFGTTFSVAGDAKGTFRLPPGCGRALVIAGQGTGLTKRAFGASGGEETHLLTSAESGLPAHSHTMAAYANCSYNAGGATCPASGGPTTFSTNNNTAADAASAHNNMQPFTTWYAIIKT